MSFAFGTLGPLTVSRSGVALGVGPAKRRMMLTALLLEANRAVSLDRLADLLWEAPSPASAVANLRTHAAALRRLLRDPDGTDRLVSLPGAYMLVVEPGELDLAEFDELTGRAREVADADPADAVRLWSEALALWRGGAAEGVPRTSGLEPVLALLDERRTAAFEEYADAVLRLGDHPALVDELRAQVAAHPLRERLSEQLALTLYRCGDVAGAIGVLSDAVAQLRAELGIDPGPSLVALQRAILERDPSLDVSRPLDSPRVTAGAVDPSAGPPRQLPPDPLVLTGRTEHLAILDAALSPGPGTVVVHGRPGAGASALALRAAHRTAERFGGGQLYVDLWYDGCAVSPFDALGSLLRGLGAEMLPDSEPERAALFRSLVAADTLVVLDNAVSAAQVRPLLPAGGTAVVASRRRLATLDAVARVAVGALADDEGVAMLEALAGTDRIAAEPVAAGHLVQLCDGLPLALRIAGARLASRPNWPVARLADQLADPAARLDVLCVEGLSVRDALRPAYAGLDDVTAEVFRLVGTLRPRSFDADVVASRLDLSYDVAEAALEELVDTRLAESRAPGRYHLPELHRLFAAELGDGPSPAARPRPGGRRTA